MSAAPITAEALAQRWGLPLSKIQEHGNSPGPYTPQQADEIDVAIVQALGWSVAWESSKRGGVPPSLGANDDVRDLAHIAVARMLEVLPRYRAEGRSGEHLRRSVRKSGTNALRRAVRDEWQEPANNADFAAARDGADENPDSLSPFDDYHPSGDKALRITQSDNGRDLSAWQIVTYGRYHLSAVHAARVMGMSAVRTALELNALTVREAYTADDRKKRLRMAKRVERLWETGALGIEKADKSKRKYPPSEFKVAVQWLRRQRWRRPADGYWEKKGGAAWEKVATVEPLSSAQVLRELDAEVRMQTRQANQQAIVRPRVPVLHFFRGEDLSQDEYEKSLEPYGDLETARFEQARYAKAAGSRQMVWPVRIDLQRAVAEIAKARRQETPESNAGSWERAQRRYEDMLLHTRRLPDDAPPLPKSPRQFYADQCARSCGFDPEFIRRETIHDKQPVHYAMACKPECVNPPDTRGVTVCGARRVAAGDALPSLPAWRVGHGTLKPAPYDEVVIVRAGGFLPDEIRPVGLFRPDTRQYERGRWSAPDFEKFKNLVQAEADAMRAECRRKTDALFRHILTMPPLVAATQELEAANHMEYLLWRREALPAGVAVIGSCITSGRVTAETWSVAEEPSEGSVQRVQWQAAQRRKWEEDLKARSGAPTGHQMSATAMVRDLNLRQRAQQVALMLEALLAAG